MRVAGRVAGTIAHLKQFAERHEELFRNAARTQLLFNDRLSDGRSRNVQPLAKLLLQQTERRREKIFEKIFGGKVFQVLQTLTNRLGNVALPSQTRIVC